MLRIVFRLIYCLFFTVFLVARQAHAEPVDARLVAIGKSQATGEFLQKRFFSGMTKPLISHGDYAYLRGKGLLWRTLTPLETELFADAQAVKMRNQGVTQTLTGKVEARTTALIFALLAMDLDKLTQDFAMHSAWQGAAWTLELTPNNTLIAAVLQSVTLSGAASLQRLRLQSKNGDITEIEFVEGTSNSLAMASLNEWLAR